MSNGRASGNDRNDTGREKTSKTARSQRSGKVKCIKGTGRRTILEMRKIIPHLRLEKKNGGWQKTGNILRHRRKKILQQEDHLISVQLEKIGMGGVKRQ